MRLTTLAKNLLERMGLRCYRSSNLPRNLDLFFDLKSLKLNMELIFDVGGNVGQFAKKALSSFPNATIHSFEPVLETFRSLELLSQQYPKLNVHRFAFGEKDGESEINIRANSVWNSLLPFNNDPRNSIGVSETVSIRTIDSFCLTNNISKIGLLKTDTEGFDAKVLAGAARMLAEGRVDAVYSEITFLASDHTHTSFTDVFELLSPYEFILYGIYQFAGDFETMHSNALFIRRPMKID